MHFESMLDSNRQMTPNDPHKLSGPMANKEFVAQASEYVQQKMKSGAPPREILSQLASAAKALAGANSASSILVLDKNGLLRNCGSANLPPDYLAAIDGLKPDAKVGTCAAAAATGCAVITPDFLADDKWAELRHLPLALGFVGAWSVPIKSPGGAVLGTFGTYYRERRQPTPEERRDMELLAGAAALILANI